MIGIYTTNIGDVWFGVACAGQQVFTTSFAPSEQETLKRLLTRVPFNVSFQVFPEPSAFAESVLASVKNVYDGNGVSQRFSLATEHLSAYTQRVLETTSLIPTGYVTSYGAIAKAAGGSPRSVGHVMASNPFAPIIPCHRVVSSDLTLGGYGGGLKTKLDFLTREKRGHTSLREIPVGDKKLKLFPVEIVLRKLAQLGTE
jgi:O-6-methylguanine DNA methyltransferase